MPIPFPSNRVQHEQCPPHEGQLSSAAPTTAVRIREVREQKDLSREQLAKRAGIDIGQLVSIEAGESPASLGTLWKLAVGLGVPFSEFLEAAESRVTVQRAGDTQVLRTDDGALESRPLVSAGISRWVETYALQLAPGGRHESEPHPRGTKEIVVVVEGALIVDIDGRSFTLARGDSIAFLADIPHTYQNPGTLPGRYHDIIVYDQ